MTVHACARVHWACMWAGAGGLDADATSCLSVCLSVCLWEDMRVPTVSIPSCMRMHTYMMVPTWLYNTTIYVCNYCMHPHALLVDACIIIHSEQPTNTLGRVRSSTPTALPGPRWDVFDRYKCKLHGINIVPRALLCHFGPATGPGLCECCGCDHSCRGSHACGAGCNGCRRCF